MSALESKTEHGGAEGETYFCAAFKKKPWKGATFSAHLRDHGMQTEQLDPLCPWMAHTLDFSKAQWIFYCLPVVLRCDSDRTR